LHAIEISMGGSGEFAASLHAGKRRLALAHDSVAGRELLLRLIDRCDVLVESPRPVSAGESDLSPDALAARHPRLIHCSLTACGVQGEIAGRGGHDLNLLAMSGVLDLLKPVDGPPVVPGVQIGGLGASSLPAVQAILASLFSRERHGRGRQLTVSMVHNLQSWMGLERSLTRGESAAQSPAAAGAVTRRTHSLLRGRLPCYNVYATRDGRYVALGGAQPRLWEAFCTAVERPEWVARQHDATLVNDVRALIAERSFADWRDFAAARGLCIEPVLTAAEAAALISGAGAAAPGAELLPGVWFADYPAAAAPGAASPVAGQHTGAILAEIGLAPAELDRLAAAGVIVLGDGDRSASSLPPNRSRAGARQSRLPID
jgi:crotonobetainyl-CoA:carnitine CoA-transferase CaiB-like acyl-CoA transferase